MSLKYLQTPSLCHTLSNSLNVLCQNTQGMLWNVLCQTRDGFMMCDAHCTAGESERARERASRQAHTVVAGEGGGACSLPRAGDVLEPARLS